MIPGKVENEAGYCHEPGKEKHAILFPNMLREKGEDQCAYSNLYHCDRDGVYLYIDAVSGQLADAIGKNEG